MISKETYKDILQESICLITFTKKDGTERIMRCTLREDLLPILGGVIVLHKEPKTISENQVRVYDLDAKGWRSFLLETVTSCQIQHINNKESK